MIKLSYRTLIPTLILLAACSPSGNPGTTPSTTPSASPSSSSSSQGAAVNGCTSYVDRTAEAADREITWDFSVANSPERCMKVKVGQTVSFRGNFTQHPLKGQNGDFDNNPFGEAFDKVSNAGLPGQEYTPLEFKVAGTFGYTCSVHNSMMGAIQVVR